MPYDRFGNWSPDPNDSNAMPPGLPAPFVDPNSSSGAGAMAASILAQQFEDWRKTFVPIELNAIKQISFNNPDILPTAVSRAKETAEGSFGAMRGILDRQNAALGVMPTQQQQTVSKRLMDLGRAAAVAGAENAARENVRANDQAILMGGTPNPNIVKG